MWIWIRLGGEVRSDEVVVALIATSDGRTFHLWANESNLVIPFAVSMLASERARNSEPEISVSRNSLGSGDLSDETFSPVHVRGNDIFNCTGRQWRSRMS